MIDAICNESQVQHILNSTLSLFHRALQLQLHADACLAALYLITIRDNSSAQFYCLWIHKRLSRRQMPRCLTRRATVEQLVGMHRISYQEEAFFRPFSCSNSLLPWYFELFVIVLSGNVRCTFGIFSSNPVHKSYLQLFQGVRYDSMNRYPSIQPFML